MMTIRFETLTRSGHKVRAIRESDGAHIAGISGYRRGDDPKVRWRAIRYDAAGDPIGRPRVFGSRANAENWIRYEDLRRRF